MAEGSAQQTSSQREWSVLLKLEVVSPARHLSEQEPQELIKRLHPQTTVDGGGKDITVRTWKAAPDAGEAAYRTTQQVRAAATALGLPPLKIIRQHATSPELRDVNVIRGSSSRLDRKDVWGILANVRLGPAGREPTPEDREAIRDHLPGEDKRVFGSGLELVLHCWVDAPDIGAVSALAGQHIKSSLTARGFDDFQLYRIQPCSPAEHFFEVYPGVAERLNGGRAR